MKSHSRLRYLLAAFLVPCQQFEKIELRVQQVDSGSAADVFREINTLRSRLESQQNSTGLGLAWSSDDKSCLEKTLNQQKILVDKITQQFSSAVPQEVLANYYLQENRLSDAQQILLKVLESNPTSIEANYLYADSLKSSKSNLSLREKHLKRVFIEKAQNEFESEIQVKAIRDITLEIPLDIAELQKYLDIWVEKDPNSKEMWLKRAEVSLKLKDPKKLEESLPYLQPNEKFYFATQAALLRGQIDKAEENAQNFINLNLQGDPRDVELRLKLVESLLSRNVVRSARQLAEKSLEKYPTQREFKERIVSTILAGAIDEKNPIGDLEKALLLNSDSVPLMYRLLEELLKDSLPSRDSPIVPSVDIVKQSEGLVRRIKNSNTGDVMSFKISAESWMVTLLFYKKIFSEADILFSRLEQQIVNQKKVVFAAKGVFQEVDFWIMGSKIKRARGQFQEAKNLVKKGVDRAQTAEQKQILLKYL